jgi:hypothetical protein
VQPLFHDSGYGAHELVQSSCRMTGEISTTGGADGAAPLTLPLEPNTLSGSAAPTKPLEIRLLTSLPSIESLNFCLNRVTDAPESGRCSVEEMVARGSSSRFRRVSHATALPVLGRQAAYQNRRALNQRRIKEIWRTCWTGGVEEVESVECVDQMTTRLTHKHLDAGAKSPEKNEKKNLQSRM